MFSRFYYFDSNILTNVSLEFNVSKIDKKNIDSLKKVDLYDKFKDNLESSLGEGGIKVSEDKNKE